MRLHTDDDCPPALCAGGCGQLTAITHIAGPYGRQSPCCDPCYNEAHGDQQEQDFGPDSCPSCGRGTLPKHYHYGQGCICPPDYD